MILEAAQFDQTCLWGSHRRSRQGLCQISPLHHQFYNFPLVQEMVVQRKLLLHFQVLNRPESQTCWNEDRRIWPEGLGSPMKMWGDCNVGGKEIKGWEPMQGFFSVVLNSGWWPRSRSKLCSLEMLTRSGSGIILIFSEFWMHEEEHGSTFDDDSPAEEEKFPA